MKLELITPTEMLLNVNGVKTLSAPGIEGDFGVWNNHAAFFTVLKEGIINYSTEEGQFKIKVGEAIFEVLNNNIKILAEQAEIVK